MVPQVLYPNPVLSKGQVFLYLEIAENVTSLGREKGNVQSFLMGNETISLGAVWGRAGCAGGVRLSAPRPQEITNSCKRNCNQEISMWVFGE